MPVYEFRCAGSHLHERTLPITSTVREAPCPECAAPSRRLISVPGLHHLGSARARAIAATERSAHEPAVVDRVPGPGRSGPPRPRDPRHARLPRP